MMEQRRMQVVEQEAASKKKGGVGAEQVMTEKQKKGRRV